MPKAASLEVNHGTNTAELLLQRVGVIFRDVFLDDLGRALHKLRQIDAHARARAQRVDLGERKGSRENARLGLASLLSFRPSPVMARTSLITYARRRVGAQMKQWA